MNRQIRLQHFLPSVIFMLAWKRHLVKGSPLQDPQSIVTHKNAPYHPTLLTFTIPFKAREPVTNSSYDALTCESQWIYVLDTGIYRDQPDSVCRDVPSYKEHGNAI